MLKVDLQKLKEKARKYDYIRFTAPDLNGIGKGMTLSGRYVDQYLENGLGLYSGLLAFGPNNEISEIKDFPDRGNGNLQLKPASAEISPVPWSGQEKYKVGEVICNAYWSDGSIQSATPRYVAQKQLEKLTSMGYKMYSAFEIEGLFMKKENLELITNGCHFANTLTFSGIEDMCMEFETMLREHGVDIHSVHHEYAPGQLEFRPEPKYGIEAADMTFKLKKALKEICQKKAHCATFMTRPFAGAGCSNGAHFNFSIWDDNDKNIFYDPSKPDNLSDQALYFVGGLLKHLKSLTAIFSPTANCYRRLHTPWAPHLITWGIDNRDAAVRLKNESVKGCYIENRSPSGSCNPYLVLAATLAAGIDGMVNKIEPPSDKKQPEVLPTTFKESLEALKQDEEMVAALGTEFVDWFMECKYQVDITKFGDHDMKSIKAEEIDKERAEYFYNM